jgi:hypothetical protein
MLVACLLAGLSTLETYYADINRRRNDIGELMDTSASSAIQTPHIIEKTT